MGHRIYIGCAGWSLPKEQWAHFPEEGSHLERYTARFPAVEINASFYRAIRPATYARWAETVPEGFRFAVKVPRQVTHVGRLQETGALDTFLPAVQALGEKLGPLLLQLPPSLALDVGTARHFLQALRERFAGEVVCEARHGDWFTAEAEALFQEFRIARVAADPPPFPEAGRPGGWAGLAYFRLHGSPRLYYSAYSPAFLASLVPVLLEAARSRPVWCIFNNTAAGAAIADALRLMELIHRPNG
ncbi:MAG: DUF72 domain-containing protein [Chloroflexia bacterium]